MSMLPLLNPIAIDIGFITIRWYGIILALAATAGLLLAVREGHRFKIKSDFFMDLLLYGGPSAIIGARLYYVAFQWQEYKDNPLEAFAIWEGGIAIHGALIGAIIAAVIYTRVKKVNFWRIADISAPSLIAGQMIGRWGNFVNQEAHGGPVEESFLSNTLHLPNWIVSHMEIQGVFYHPTFLYESIWNLAGLLVLFWLRRRPFLRAGELFASYFILYSIGRFFVEGLRTDSLAFVGPAWLVSFMNGLWAPMDIVFEQGSMLMNGGNIRMAQFISLMLIVAAIVLIIVRRKMGYATARYSDPVVFGGRSADSGQGDSGDGKSSNGQGMHSGLEGSIGSEKGSSADRGHVSSRAEGKSSVDAGRQEQGNGDRLKPGNPFL